MTLNRRVFLLSATMPLYAAAPLQALSPEEARVIEALCDQIIPADDAPGAKKAGVLYYIDQQLAGPLKRFAPLYHAGIPRLQVVCAERFHSQFADLPYAEQTALLRDIDAGRVDGLASFFTLVIDHTMQGFYGSSEHGGNRDEASWKMLGIRDVMGEHRH